MHRETKHYLVLTHNEPSVTFGWVIGTFFFTFLKTHKAEPLHVLTSTTCTKNATQTSYVVQICWIESKLISALNGELWSLLCMHSEVGRHGSHRCRGESRYTGQETEHNCSILSVAEEHLNNYSTNTEYSKWVGSIWEPSSLKTIEVHLKI